MPKLLSLDGGSVYGIYGAHILDNVDTSKFDAIIGTSIGSALGAAVATDVDINLVNFFHNNMKHIFAGRWYKKFKPLTPRYNGNALEECLKKTFDGIALGDVKTPLFITAVNMHDERLKVFYSGDPSDGSRKLWECVRCSTAAPTYLPPYDGYTDGGIYCNQPSVVGIAGVCSKMGWKLEDIEVCSIGTGSSISESNIKEWSHLSWGLWILGAVLNGSSSTMNDYITRALPIKRFTRLQPLREKGWALDSASDMLKAEAAWEDDIQRGIQIVKDF